MPPSCFSSLQAVDTPLYKASDLLIFPVILKQQSGLLLMHLKENVKSSEIDFERLGCWMKTFRIRDENVYSLETLWKVRLERHRKMIVLLQDR
jgi:3'-phosphoadenosine 5'-phosphosulfate sulfotransferase (PAPS reductase)/FAD synthetase